MKYESTSAEWRVPFDGKRLLVRWCPEDEHPWRVTWSNEGALKAVEHATARDALRAAADQAPGIYRDALLAAAADPPVIAKG